MVVVVVVKWVLLPSSSSSFVVLFGCVIFFLQGFKHVQEVLQKHLDRSDSLLLSFLAADVDEKAAISFDAFLHLVQDAGFNFAISDLEAVFGRSDDDQVLCVRVRVCVFVCVCVCVCVLACVGRVLACVRVLFHGCHRSVD